jgi:Putative DNA-binding domain
MSPISDAQRENTKLVLKELFSLWDKRSGLYGNVFFASAVGKGYDKKKWRNVTSFLLPMHRDEVRSVGLQADYGDFKVVDGAMSLDEAKTVLSNVIERDRLCLPGIPEIEIQASLHQNSSRQFQHSGPSRFPVFYPCYEFNFSVDQDFKGDSTQDVLYSVGLPVFPSAAAAMESYLSTRLGDNSQYSGVLAALVPDYRGKIKEIRIGTNSVQVGIECLAGSSEKDLIGKLFVRYYRGISVTSDLNFTDHKASAKIGDFPRDLLVVLLARKDGELVDRKSFLAGSQYITEGVTIEAPEQDIEQVIQMGESDTVEFKREIPQNREQIAIGATAFANRRGGRIFIGVADNCEICGYRLEKPKDTITQILRSHCYPPLNVSVDEIQIRNLPVVVVTIPEGADKPYEVKDKGVYIRAGATKRLANRYELDEMYGTKEGVRNLFP